MSTAPGTVSHDRCNTQTRTMSVSGRKGKRKAALKPQPPAKRADTRPSRSSTKSSPAKPTVHESENEPGNGPEDEPQDESEHGDPTYQDRTVKDGKLQRNRAMAVLCLKREGGRCAITGFRIAQAAHIIPFAWDNSKETHRETLNLVTSLEEFDIPLQEFVRRKRLGFSDEPSNMIGLSPNLHGAWGHGYFGLRPITVIPERKDGVPMGDVIFQFVWLPRGSYKNYASPVDLKKEKADNSQSLICKLSGYTRPHGLRITSTRTKTSIESGHLFHIKCPLEEAEKMRDMLAIQWALIRISAMSGAADAIDHGFDPTPDADWVVLPWLADQVGRTYNSEDLDQRTEGREAEDSGDSESA